MDVQALINQSSKLSEDYEKFYLRSQAIYRTEMKLRDGKCRDKALLKKLAKQRQTLDRIANAMLLAALDIDEEVDKHEVSV